MNFSLGSFITRVRSGMRQDPVRDWLVILTIALLAFVSLVAWNVWAFDTVARGGVLGTTPSEAPRTLNKSALDSIHDIFAKRAIEKEKYVTGAYRYADPSQ